MGDKRVASSGGELAIAIVARDHRLLEGSGDSVVAEALAGKTADVSTEAIVNPNDRWRVKGATPAVLSALLGHV